MHVRQTTVTRNDRSPMVLSRDRGTTTPTLQIFPPSKKIVQLALSGGALLPVHLQLIPVNYAPIFVAVVVHVHPVQPLATPMVPLTIGSLTEHFAVNSPDVCTCRRLCDAILSSFQRIVLSANWFVGETSVKRNRDRIGLSIIIIILLLRVLPGNVRL